jgi:hypothetical protein
MKRPPESVAGLMVPQILFQCHHCCVTLQVPLSFAGQQGPCPQCKQILLTPSTQDVPTAAEKPSAAQWSRPVAGFVAHTPSLMARSFSKPEKHMKSLNRGILPDQAIHHQHEMKKEQRRDTRMVLWFLLVILFLAAATYIMKSMVLGS